ncbi:MAG: hypothetical protein KDD69_12235 [Bdellovibrionales bacterium]|nr:hypothetical protein [Bdellovibrionales bacterium]
MVNFTTAAAERLESGFATMLQRAEGLGMESWEPGLSTAELLDLARRFIPARLAKIEGKVEEDLTRLSPAELLDKIGYDTFFRWEGRVYALDLTSGGMSVVANKKRKLRELSVFTSKIGIDNVAVYVDRNFEDSDERLVELLEAIQANALDIRVQRGGETKVFQYWS